MEQPIEIEVNTKDGSILIHPRNIDPIISLEAYYALGNPGVDALSLFCKGHFSQIPEDIEFSPYINASFEPVLRQAATCLSNNGIYWPDNNSNTENRQPNNISESLEITDSWVIFAKPRSSTALIKDVECLQTKLEELRANGGRIPNLAEKFVTELSNETPLQDNGRGLPNGNLPNAGLNTPTELFFPKAFNDQQVKIIDKLERNDGVVVQGPPGTGKTHTIANIVCHYLATGRRVLVTSKGEPALSVLQEQIPEELRGLTISLLTNERQGMEQIENAVQSLERLASDTDLVQLRREVKHNEQVVQQIKQKLNQIDTQIEEWGRKQFSPIEGRLTNAAPNITPMELAKQVMNDQDGHDWFADKLGSSEQYTPQFNNADIAKIRAARRRVGEDIVYVGRHIPNVQDLPDGANILAIHNDLSKSANIAQDLQNGNIPPLAVSVNNAIERAKLIGVQLKDCSALLEKFESDHENYHWLKQLYRSWIGNIKKPDNNAELFDELLTTLSTLVKQRAQFVTTRVQLPDPSACFENVTIALTNLAGGNRAFGLLPFVKKEAKIIIKQARVDGEIPTNQQQWRQVLDYTTFQDNAKKFAEKWNHAGQEIGLPKFVYRYGGKFGNIYNTCEWINKAKGIASRHSALRQEVKLLFPVGIDATSLGADRSEIDKTIHAIEQNLSCINLQSQREKLTDLTNKLENSDGEIAEELRNFITNTIGNTACEQNEVSEKWQKLIAELNRINRILVDLAVIKGIADKIQASGARIWSEKLKTEPLLTIEDALTPTDWHQTWKWKQYLHEIDGREQIKRLSKDRSSLDNRLKQTFSELVRLKTNIGLHNSMTDHVKGALTRFVTAVGRIGRGTGIRAPRYRRDAYRAMQECYDGVPCWIMPTWRVSESLPSAFGAFDLVIIDEASQSDITVLPTILRAKKLLIVGDDKQVSPTAAFIPEKQMDQLRHNFLTEQLFPELLLPDISVYELAYAMFPSQRIMLTEHFRCVEPIIRFSMQQFYDNQLIPLRIPKASEKFTPPLVDVYCQYAQRDERRKINEVEAEAIVAEIKELVSNQEYNGRSIGIVSLIGAYQAKYIQEQLLRELGEDVFQQYKIACGDATTFQGKERDIMFLSMVVGAGQGAVMNRRDAEQRMNVALSRARDRMYLYRSIQEADLRHENDLRLKILQHFANPMPQQQTIDNPIDLCDSGFERDVYNRLIEKGYNVTPQVKVGAFSIDLVVEGENDRRLAIELDGDKYHPPEQWMADWNRQRTMERVGWTFWRCWGSSYTINPEGCINELLSVLENRQIFPCEGNGGANIYTETRIYETQDFAHVH